MPKFFSILFSIVVISACSGSSGDGNGGASVDRSTLPETSSKFETTPMSFPNGIATDLHSFGIYNTKCSCSITHYGWDFTPHWAGYQDNRVPIVAVADGIIVNVVPRATNKYQGQSVDTFVIVEAVARELDVHYTFEPFVELGETQSLAYINVKSGESVKAGDVLGYLPKLSGNLGEHLIHLDFKIGASNIDGTFYCPSNYFSSAWLSQDSSTLLSVAGTCTSLCCE